MLYRDEVLDHYKHPHNFGELSDATCRSSGSNPSCGDSVNLSLKIEKGIITDAKFTGVGCALSTASASILTDFIKGKSVDEALKISQTNLEDWLGEINPGRQKCILLPLSALKKMLS